MQQFLDGSRCLEFCNTLPCFQVLGWVFRAIPGQLDISVMRCETFQINLVLLQASCRIAYLTTHILFSIQAELHYFTREYRNKLHLVHCETTPYELEDQCIHIFYHSSVVSCNVVSCNAFLEYQVWMVSLRYASFGASVEYYNCQSIGRYRRDIVNFTSYFNCAGINYEYEEYSNRFYRRYSNKQRCLYWTPNNNLDIELRLDRYASSS